MTCAAECAREIGQLDGLPAVVQVLSNSSATPEMRAHAAGVLAECCQHGTTTNQIGTLAG